MYLIRFKVFVNVIPDVSRIMENIFPNEGRITVGGYQMLKGVPIERTEMARDPYSPIYESHIPTV